jgi:hypothetical protein
LTLDEILARYGALDPAEQKRIAELAVAARAGLAWLPNPGPQRDAYLSEADELLYGGEAGGGKSDLLLGLAVNAHRRSLILRRINQDAAELGNRLVEILGSDRGYRQSPPTLKLLDKLIELRGCELEKDKQRFKGRARDLIGFDELADFLESQYVFIIGWLRSTIPGQRCRVVCASNPPTTAEGQWITKRWGAWLDPNHPNPAEDGELRWYVRVGDEDVEVEGPGPHEIEGRSVPVKALSRTFIRAPLESNPDLAKTDYDARLEGMPDELRRAYREGDFTVGMSDDDWQVIPTAWIEAAQQRWTPKIPPRTPMTAMAVDVAPGGGDKRVICWRYEGWFAPFDAKREVDKTGRLTASAVVLHRRDNCPVIVDLGGGWGGDAVIALKDNSISCVAFNGVVVSSARTRDGKLKFRNKRAEAVWRFREALDPSQEGGSVVALPPDAELRADLAAYRWEHTIGGILIEDKEKIKERIGRSPDKGDGAVMCLSEGQRAVEKQSRERKRGNQGVRANLGYGSLKRGPGYGR